MDQDPELRKLLKKYPKHTAAIRYKRKTDGFTNIWFLGALSSADNEQTLRDHWERWYPLTDFLGWAIK